jgi:hypothetical protein
LVVDQFPKTGSSYVARFLLAFSVSQTGGFLMMGIYRLIRIEGVGCCFFIDRAMGLSSK